MKNTILIWIAGVPCVLWALIINQLSKEDGSGKEVSAGLSLTNNSFRDFESKRDWIIIYFSPGCDACEHEASYFVINRQLLASYNVYFISDAPMKELTQFFLEHGMDKIPGFKVLHDQNKEVRTRFHIKSYPTILFFNKRRGLINRIEGETSFSKILPLLTP